MSVKRHLQNLFIAAAICVGISWITDREPPVTYERAAVATEIGSTPEPAPSPGGTVPIHLTGRRDRVCPTFADRRFHDSARAEFALEDDSWTPIEPDPNLDVYRYIDLPRKVHAGPGKLVLDVTWRCNPTHYLWPIRTTVVIPVDVVMAN